MLKKGINPNEGNKCKSSHVGRQERWWWRSSRVRAGWTGQRDCGLPAQDSQPKAGYTGHFSLIETKPIDGWWIQKWIQLLTFRISLFTTMFNLYFFWLAVMAVCGRRSAERNLTEAARAGALLRWDGEHSSAVAAAYCSAAQQFRLMAQ